MKRILVVVMIASIVLSMFEAFLPKVKVQAADNIILQDNFDSDVVGAWPSGGWTCQWYVKGPGSLDPVVSDSYSHSAPNSVQLQAHSYIIYKDFSSSGNLIGYEGCLMSIGPDSNPDIGFFKEQVGNFFARLYADVRLYDGFIWASSTDDPSPTELQAFSPNTWYQIRVILDKTSRNYSVWINGVLVAQNLLVPHDPNEILSVSLKEDSASYNTPCYFDDVKVFQSATTYTVTIGAHCNTEGVDLNIPINEDGSYTGFDTPYTFTGLTGTHTFTVLDRDYDNHPFAYWDSMSSGQTSTTISVSGAGTHTAHYQALPYLPQAVTATPDEEGNKIDLTWSPPNAPAGYVLQNYYIYRGITPDFVIPWNLPYGSVGAAPPHQFQDNIQDNSVYYYRVVANFQQGLSDASTPVGCARLESVKGIESTITGITSLSVPLLHFYSLQQNFYLFTGNKDAQGNPVVYWCQNCLDEMQNWDPVGFCYSIMYIFSYNWNTGQKSLQHGSPPTPILNKDVPDTLYFKAEITQGSLSMTNSIGSWSWSDLHLTSNAFISTINNPYGSALPIDSPNLDVVAGGILFTPTPTDVTFNSGQGYVSCEAEIGGKWISALNNGLVGDSSGVATAETSTGLQWNNLINSAYYYHQDGAHDWKGVFFTPNFNAQVTQEILFGTLGKIANTLVLSVACPVYLDLYDDQGRCVGYNQTSGAVDFQIGNVVWVSNQTLLVFDSVGTYRLVVTGTESGTFTLQITWQNETGDTATLWDSNETITEGASMYWALSPTAGGSYIASKSGLGPPTPSVGGEWAPITFHALTPMNKLQLLAPWISLISLMTVLVTSFVYIRRKRRQS